jgi:hypothetical protein
MLDREYIAQTCFSLQQWLLLIEFDYWVCPSMYDVFTFALVTPFVFTDWLFLTEEPMVVA